MQDSDNDLSREIRVFISSTFRDMDSERNYLVKNIFPQLRKRCSERGVEFTELDLRWGVTEEEAKQGKVIKICLSEIDRCRPSMPFFIGILGERYGWIPDKEDLEKHKEILDDFGWVEKDVKNEMSITEMEMQYAVLRNPEMKGKAFFFLRKSENIPEVFQEKSGSLTAEKLKKLKGYLREQKDFPVHDYHNNEELGKQVEEELWNVIEQYFPTEFDNNPLTLTRKEHATFAHSRTTLYIGGEKYYQKLNNHFESDNQPIVITGASGMGKSALLANWLGHFREHHPDVFILQHYIGGAPDSTDYAQVIRRMMEEMKKEFEIIAEIPSELEKLKDALPIFFAKSNTKGKWILVLDALNQIEDRDNARLLNWLPDFIPPFIRVFLSSTTGITMERLQKRNWETTIIEPLTFCDRIELISSYLKKYSKNLPIETIKQIAEDKESENPLILRTLLDELRIFGKHRELYQRIEYYISTKSPEEFFDRVLERMEMDYESDHKGMVREILSLIYCSRKGISEKELLEITNIPPLYWSPLYIALENHLINHSGLLNISHDYLKQAINRRYFVSEIDKIKTHTKLSEYFKKDRQSARSLDELPWQYIYANQKEELKNYLVDLEVFNLLFEKDKYAFLGFWKYLENDFIVENEYDKSIKLAENDSNTRNKFGTIFSNLGSLFLFVGKAQKALDYYNKLATILEWNSSVSLPDLAMTYSNIGVCFSEIGKYTEAIAYKLRALAIQKNIYPNNHLELALSYNNLGVSYSLVGDFNKGLEYYNMALKIRERLLPHEHPLLILSLNNIALSFRDSGNIEKAVEYAIKAATINEKISPFEHIDLTSSYSIIGNLCNILGDYNNALVYSFKSLNIQEKVLTHNHPDLATTFDTIGNIYANLGEFDKALEFHFKALKIKERVFGIDNIETALTYNNIAVEYNEKGEFDLSIEYHFKALKIKQCVFGDDNIKIAYNYSNLGCVYNAIKKYELALEYHFKALEIQKRVLGADNIDVATTYNNIGLSYSNMSSYKLALEFYTYALQIKRKVLGEMHVTVSSTLVNIGMVYKKKRMFFLALDFFFKSVEIDKRIFGKVNIHSATTLFNIGSSYSDDYDYDKALIYYFKALEFCDNTSDKNSIFKGTILNDIGMCLFYKGNFTEALNYFMKSYVIRKTRFGTSHRETISACRWLSETHKEIGNQVEAQRWDDESKSN